MQELKYVGQPVTRIDGREKVLGAAQYVDDLEFGPEPATRLGGRKPLCPREDPQQ